MGQAPAIAEEAEVQEGDSQGRKIGREKHCTADPRIDERVERRERLVIEFEQSLQPRAENFVLVMHVRQRRAVDDRSLKDAETAD